MLVVVVGALAFMVDQAGQNLEARSIPGGFDFIEDPVGIFVSEGIDTAPDTGGRALWVGMVNTLRIAGIGIVVATILGVIVGLGRLSKNWMVRKIASIYIETIRNIPLLVQMILIFVVFGTLADVDFDIGPANRWLHISNKGISIPRVFGLDGSWQWAAFMFIGAVVAWFVHRARVRKQDATGAITYPVLSALGVMAVFGIVGWFVHPVMGFLGPVWGAIADLLVAIPEAAVQIGLAVLFVGLAVWWIRRFLRSLSSGGGRAKLSDDDWFRMIFASVGALIGAFVVLVAWPGFSSWLLNSGRDLFELLEIRFGDGNGGAPLDAKRPDVVKPGNFANYGPAGWNMSAGFAAVFGGVVFYTSAFIAEIVRGGILAVPKGQIEAASAIGLSRAQSLRHIVLPQALRIIMPPMGNQYLNLTKNTSLAVAVGMSDVVQIGQTVYNQTGKTLPVVAIWMLFYLTVSLTISVVVNFFNVRLKLVER
jgi:general L-amino acid transport system permease protein